MSALARALARSLLALLALSYGLQSRAEVSPLADLNTGPNPATAGSMINEGAVRFDGRTLFSASTLRTGRELWVSDGTPQGTRLVIDFCPGRCSGMPSSVQFTLINGDLYFSATDGIHGFELWRWRGGEDAPRMVVDLNPGAPGSAPRVLGTRSFSISGVPVVRHYLAATRADVGRELWRLVSTSTPSVALERDIVAGSASSNPASVEVIGRISAEPGTDSIGLLALNADGLRVLWVLGHGNATAPPNSIRVFDPFIVQAGRQLSTELVKVGSVTYVEVDDDNNDREELWAIQSPSSAFQLRTAFSLGQLTAQPGLNRLFYTERAIAGGPTLLMVTDGTAAGTRALGGTSTPRTLTAVSTGLIYTIVSPSEGVQLHRSDGTAAGTTLVRTLLAGRVPGSLTVAATGSRTHVLLGFDDKLWISDGFIGGTRDISGVIAAGGAGQFTGLLPLEDLDAIVAWTPEPGSSAEPYFTGGSAASTVSLGNLASDSGDSDPIPVATISGRLLLQATLPGASSQLHSLALDGTGALQTLPFDALTTQGSGTHFGLAWLRVLGGLLQTDGTPAGSALLDGLPAFDSDGPECVIERAGVRYFVAGRSTAPGPQIWRSDGTSAGTVPLTALPPSSGNAAIQECRSDSFATNLARLGDDIVFPAAADNTGEELYRLRPDLSLSVVADINPGAGDSVPGQFVELPGRLMFGADDGVFGRELWTSDGTGQGTRRLTDINPGNGDALTIDTSTRGLIRAGNRVFFAAFNLDTGRELYVSDGTAAGTRLVRDLFAGPGSAFVGAGPRVAAAVGDELVFGASTTLGCTLVRSNGSLAGTRCAHDPARARFGPIGEIVATPGGIVVFVAARLDLEQGEEIHALLGDQLLTLSGADIAPGPPSSAPRFLRVDGESVYFQADDGNTGRELWRLDVSNAARVFANGFEAP